MSWPLPRVKERLARPHIEYLGVMREATPDEMVFQVGHVANKLMQHAPLPSGEMRRLPCEIGIHTTVLAGLDALARRQRGP